MDKVYKTKPNNLADLRAAILQAFADIPVHLCNKVCNAVPERLTLCAENNGAHFEHFL